MGKLVAFFQEGVEGSSLSCVASVSFNGKVGGSCGLF